MQRTSVYAKSSSSSPLLRHYFAKKVSVQLHCVDLTVKKLGELAYICGNRSKNKSVLHFFEMCSFCKSFQTVLWF